MVNAFPIVMYLRIFSLVLNQGASKTKYSGPDKADQMNSTPFHVFIVHSYGINGNRSCIVAKG